MRSTSASDAFERAMAQLQEAMTGKMEPPPPWVIPLKDYYEESEREQNELIELQREQLSRLERAGLMPTHHSAASAGGAAAVEACLATTPSAGMAPGEFDRSRNRPTRSMSFAANFLRCSRRGTEGRNSLSKRQSLSLQDGGGGGALGSSNNLLQRSTPLVRKQSSFGLGALLSDGMSSSESRASFGLSSPASPPSAHSHQEERRTSPHPNGDGSGASSAAVASTDGAVRLSTSLKEVLQYDANGRPVRLKPVYNPYRNYNADDASQLLSLRPHTLELLARSTFEVASQKRDPQQALRLGQEQLKAVCRVPQQQQQQPGSHDEVVSAHVRDPLKRQEMLARMYEWRSREAEQLEIHRRQEVLAVCQERDQWDLINRRERSILLKVDSVQRKAASIQAAKMHERQRLDDLKVSSQHRVALDCLCGAEQSFRRHIVAAEESIAADILGRAQR